MTWILLVLTYGLIKGIREILKKKAMERNTPLEVLLLYTFLSFIFVLPEIKGAFNEDIPTLLVVALKSFCIFLAWIFGFNSIKHLPVSLYGILDLARVLFSTSLGVIVLHENMGTCEITGCSLVCLGLLLLKFSPRKKAVHAAGQKLSKDSENTEHVAAIFIILTFASSLLNAFSGLMDKLILTNTSITDGHLQFWYMFFLVLYYLILILVRSIKKKESCDFRSALKNPWIWVLAILFVVGDRCLFIANTYSESKVTVMTLLKQSCCIVTILAGKFIFHEKNILKKLICAAIVITGIVIAVS